MIAPAGAHDDVVSLDGLTRTKDRCVLLDRVDIVSENGDVASMDSGPEVWKGYDPESGVCPEYAAIFSFNVYGENVLGKNNLFPSTSGLSIDTWSPLVYPAWRLLKNVTVSQNFLVNQCPKMFFWKNE